MKCPVPGCDNYSFEDGHPFCPSCGLLGSNAPLVRENLQLWDEFSNDPLNFLDFYLEKKMSEFTRGILVNFRLYEVEHITYAQMADAMDVDVQILGEDPNSMAGLRPDYAIHESLRKKLNDLKASYIQEPVPCRENVARLSNSMAEFRGVSNEYASRMQEWTRAAHQADDAETSRREQQYYRAIADKDRRISELEKQLAEHPRRPDARHHQPCPNCGSMFPLVQKKITDTRYMIRDERNFNRPLTRIELDTWGIDLPFDKATKLFNEDLAYYLAGSLVYAAESGATLNPIHILFWEMRFGPLGFDKSDPD